MRLMVFILCCSFFYSLSLSISAESLQLEVTKTVTLQIPEEKIYGVSLLVKDYFLNIDNGNATIQFFDLDGRFLGTQSRKGVGPGEMLLPSTMSYQNASILVGDMMRQGVHLFKLSRNQLINPVFIPLPFRPYDVALLDNFILATGTYKETAQSLDIQYLVIVKYRYEFHNLHVNVFN